MVRRGHLRSGRARLAVAHVDELWFAWDNGGAGTMTLRWSGSLIGELTVAFN
jgi:hypothetical protein